MAEPLTLYMDLMSQPCRALFQLIAYNKLPVKLVTVQIGKMQHRTPEHAKLNPHKKLPFLQIGEQGLAESGAMLTYLALRFQLTGWYPEDLAQRAQVDAVLHWHHLNIRHPVATMVFNRSLAPRRGVPSSEAAAIRAEGLLHANLQILEEVWLKGGQGLFLAGGDISLGDLQVCAELEMMKLLDGAQGPSYSQLLSGHPATCEWMGRVAAHLGPVHEQSNALLHKVAAIHVKQKAKATEAHSKL